MPSFDIVSEVDMHEVTNAVDQANREITNRFDFKGSNAHFEQSKQDITIIAPSEFQAKQMLEILENKLVKRGIVIGSLDIQEPETTLKETRQKVSIKQGIDQDTAKQLVKAIKNSKLKVQAAIQGEQVRVTGKKRDDLQETIAFIREQKLSLPLQFTNFRE